jgi:hypothetical protein
MGLQERRRIKMLQDEVLPSVKAEIKELCGKEIEWDVDWNSFKDMESLDNIEYQGIRLICDVFRSICYDEMGREAVREGIHKIIVKNFETVADVKNSFENGIFTVYGAWGQSWDGYPREDEMKTLLEKGL